MSPPPAAGVSTEVHVPASLTPKFVNMLRFLVTSIHRRAEMPGPWKVVVTVSRDSTLTPESPTMAWAREYPVEFRWVDQALWDRYAADASRLGRPTHEYTATSLQVHMHDYDSDVVLFMDADTVVAGSLADIIRRAAGGHALSGWLAWFPPGVDLFEVLRRRGYSFPEGRHAFSGYGWSFLEPRWCPPYFNGGFLVCSRHVADDLSRVLPDEIEWVCREHYDYFHLQVALCVAVVAHSIPYSVLDERYNFGNGPWPTPILDGPAREELLQAARATARDVRVVHYCVQTPEFAKHDVMRDDGAIQRFLERADLSDGNLHLQCLLRPLWWKGSEGRAALATSETDAVAPPGHGTAGGSRQ